MSTITEYVTLQKVECGRCGGVYAITDRHYEWCREHSEFWHCPYCETGWGFDHDDSPLAKAKREAEAQKRRAEQAARRAASAELRADRERDRANGYKGVMRKTQKRVANGVCPCCNRSFENLRRHMETKHPDYDPSASLRVVRRGGPWYHIEDEYGMQVSDPVRGHERAHALREAMLP